MSHVLTVCLLNKELFRLRCKTIQNLRVDNFGLRNHIETVFLLLLMQVVLWNVSAQNREVNANVDKLYNVTDGSANRTALLIPLSELQDQSGFFSVYIIYVSVFP
jgi:hypothetical protein